MLFLLFRKPFIYIIMCSQKPCLTEANLWSFAFRCHLLFNFLTLFQRNRLRYRILIINFAANKGMRVSASDCRK